MLEITGEAAQGPKSSRSPQMAGGPTPDPVKSISRLSCSLPTKSCRTRSLSEKQNKLVPEAATGVVESALPANQSRKRNSQPAPTRPRGISLPSLHGRPTFNTAAVVGVEDIFMRNMTKSPESDSSKGSYHSHNGKTCDKDCNPSDEKPEPVLSHSPQFRSVSPTDRYMSPIGTPHHCDASPKRMLPPNEHFSIGVASEGGLKRRDTIARALGLSEQTASVEVRRSHSDPSPEETGGTAGSRALAGSSSQRELLFLKSPPRKYFSVSGEGLASENPFSLSLGTASPTEGILSPMTLGPVASKCLLTQPLEKNDSFEVLKRGDIGRTSVDVLDDPSTRRFRDTYKGYLSLDNLTSRSGRACVVTVTSESHPTLSKGSRAFAYVFDTSNMSDTEKSDLISLGQCYSGFADSVHAHTGKNLVPVPRDFIVGTEHVYVLTDWHARNYSHLAASHATRTDENMDLRKMLVRKAVLALAEVHSAGFVHLNLSLRKILVSTTEKMSSLRASSNFSVLLCGFFKVLAQRLHMLTIQDIAKSYPARYAPPEAFALSDNQIVSIDALKQYDIFSLGVCSFRILIGVFPWERVAISDHRFEAYVRGDFKKFWNLIENELQKPVDLSIKDLVMHMMSLDPSRRMSAAKLYNHPAISQNTFQSTKQQDEYIDGFKEGFVAEDVYSAYILSAMKLRNSISSLEN